VIIIEGDPAGQKGREESKTLATDQNAEPGLRFARRLYVLLGDMSDKDRADAEGMLEMMALHLHWFRKSKEGN
jgi:hypothetical protein